ncbi:Ketoacyl-synthetase C-terminal extension [Clostridium cavendishii DSM 21758]|uniref:Ketoacyl-synthetase C-terminal extension n=1 Tax=Clostridium cavendishii DSM 21758 TaxID=1121302 RepID=A0A1M6KWE3_9CLOT|nr:SDR family NAD(P)-dependent oxidoreductase [Clostridium cavendishii]SHJ63210.1 Ketoacyl-synthetase C-terminal extension [Clostridium cavendishii DSM 21758]
MKTDFLNLKNISSKNFTSREVAGKEMDNQIAIIGIGIKMPMADTLQEYWENIKNGVDCIRTLPEERQEDVLNYYKTVYSDDDNIKFLKGAYINDIDKFDCNFFNMSPREAKLMNPLQRLFLQTTYSALEDGGYGGDDLRGSKTGVFLGLVSDLEGYKYKEIIHNVDKSSLPVSTTGNLSSIIASRINYLLDFKGPSMLIDTACSSSMVAVHIACESLKRGECEYAIAGGIKVNFTPIDSKYYKIGIEAEDGITRTFDNNANGSGMGEGVAAILLKPVNKAIEDKDNIYAIIRGSSINQDGTCMGITAPNPLAHTELLKATWNNAKINPETLSYIEAHGTGTSIGDPIEIDGLIGAFREYTSKKQFCAIGSVKSNIGHLYECAGLAGLIKAVLMIKNKTLPPTIHFNEPSKKINFLDSPFYVNSKLASWDSKFRRCGISSFGISGTNCHIVLEEYKQSNQKLMKERDIKKEEKHIFTLTAKSLTSLQNMIKQYKTFLEYNSDINIKDLCYTINCGRGQYNYRIAVIVRNASELRIKLSSINEKDLCRSEDNVYMYGEYRVVSEEEKKLTGQGITIREKEKNNILYDYKLRNYSIESLFTEQTVKEICYEFIKGTDINWKYYYKNQDYHKICLPTYPFDKQRFWLDLDCNMNKNGESSEKSLYYKINWLKVEANITENEDVIDDYVFIYRNSNLIDDTINILQSRGKKIITVKLGLEFEKISDHSYIIGNSMEDYEKLFCSMNIVSNIAIVYEPTINLYKDLDDINSINGAVLNLIYLTKVISKYYTDEKVYIFLISRFAYEVTSNESMIYPYNAALIGLSKVINIENESIKCKAIDLDEKTNNSVILDEIKNTSDYKIVCYREGSRYVQLLEETSIENEIVKEIPIKKNGVYVITGGAGGIGLEICKYLAAKSEITLILVNRTKFPEKDQWDEIVKSNKNFKLVSKIKNIQNLIRTGTNIELRCADVTNFIEMRELINDIREKHGEINGVIHAAGVGSFRTIKEIDVKNFSEVFDPKVKGTVILDQLTMEDPLDFFVLFSSIATVFPAFGQSHYVAANAFMDSYSVYRNKIGKYTLCINWTTWKDTGMACDNGINIDTIFKAIPNDKAISGFKNALKAGIKQIIIGQLNYNSSKVNLIDKKSIKLSDEIEKKISFRKKNDTLEKHMKNKNIKKEVKIIGKDNGKYNKVERTLAEICSEQLGFSDINIYESFFELGADSIMIKKIHEEINNKFPNIVEVVDLFEYSSINKLAQFIMQKLEFTSSHILIEKNENKLVNYNYDDISIKITDDNYDDRDVAIIGMDVKLPMANNLEEFWENIENKINSITNFPIERQKEVEKYLIHNNKDFKNVKYNPGAYLTDIDKFDYSFFKIAPNEANLMDPCQRLFIQSAWKAVEDAGYGGNKLKGTNTGVFVGFSNNLRDSYGRLFFEDDFIEPAAIVGNMQTILANRISYLMGINGPSVVLDTACSSSLVAVHYACNSILSKDCDMAIVGGVRLNILPICNENETMGIESSDGETRAFDNNSDGAGVGEGIATIVVKKISKAIKDRDHIYGVIKATSINQDGRSNGLTSPNPFAHGELIKTAWSKANINPETITYIETHGTGTNLGDPIEIQGIKHAFKGYTDKKQFCAIGSVKTNIGHLFEAAGIVNLIKVVLAMKNRKLPPTINFINPNKNISFENSPVYVNTKLSEWRPECNILRGGVSAFGFGGTNCHVTIEEPPVIRKDRKVNDIDSFEVLTISANSKESLKQLVLEYNDFFKRQIDFNLKDVCYTANTGRGHYKFNIAMILKDKEDLLSKLEELNLNGFESLEKDLIYFGEVNPQNDIDINKYSKQDVLIADKISLGSFKELCKLYVAGVKIDWDSMYKNEEVFRTKLPTYHFEKKKCWLEFSDVINKFDNNNSLYYGTRWIEHSIKNNESKEKNEVILIFSSLKSINKELIDELRKTNAIVYEVYMEDKFYKIDDQKYIISNKEEDYEKLLKILEDKNIKKIIHSFTLDCNLKDVDSLDVLKQCQEKGVYSLFALLKSVNKMKFSNKIDMIIISSNVYEITGEEENINPHNATVFGLGRVISQEFPNIKCRSIDVSSDISVKEIFNEIFISEEFYQVAYRNGKRYVEEFCEINLDSFEENSTTLKEDGIYVITGGTGGIGLEVAKDLATRAKVNLALINRTPIPSKEKWNEILSNSRDAKLCKKVRRLKEIESIAATVQCFSANICDLSEMTNLIDNLRERYGNINGIIHCAAVPGDGFIINKQREVFDEVLCPKVQGTWVLDKVTEKDNLDFFLIFSSALSMIGEAGQGDYVAANSYLDVFAKYRNRKNKRTITIDWVSWKSAGMSVEYGFNVDKIFKAISTNDALEALNKVLHKNVKQILIGELNFDGEYIYIMNEFPMKVSEKIMDLISQKESLYVNKKKVLASNSKKSVILKGIDNDKITDTYLKIGNIWCEVLGIEEIHVDESFYELGGNSILAIRLLRKIQKEFSKITEISLNDILSLSTINQLAQYIESKLIKQDFENNNISGIESKNIKKGELTIKCFSNGMLTSNCYLLESEGEGVLIDAGTNSDIIMKAISESSIRLRYIIITHAHIDHMLSMDEIREKTGARILIHEDDKDGLENCLGALIINKRYSLKESDRCIKEGDVIKFGNVKLEVIHTPGHTKGCICLKTGNKIFTGDTLLKGGYGAPDEEYGNESDLMNSILNKLMTYEDDIIIYPGHGEYSTIGKERNNEFYRSYTIH